ncbi:5-formyltetrahydrofolate cyclo-ligase [Listeria newyorkensis]|uniref:5-formyltetrahydrofolate cyclo-ligase n=1 Tax=Listeria newyorkensis TaxID=1497681 RepID=A0ABX4XR92_9LIST|nr:5-formyltetrahydrofolate cyclo-ligase [Listeria newyorkensis]KGL40075.1 5-formyltetrahydrofolate cyclo-ligase [Listeria newyorkensis]PNP93357.1 5-formyltetrahydrofolate cyclo-ligase [Listeria newyorkensis]WAO21197.1 5-formyltetrahydrofolate cyclo-ligase [Listeria newyorkensis]SQC55760.1 5-formyltetrahydrofolate cyclo-ligase family protein [Listeria newyorkensis]
MTAKATLREQILTELQKMDRATYEQRSRAIAEQLFQEEIWKKATTIGITIARFPEIATRAIIERAWQDGKTVAIPETNNKSKAMKFRVYKESDELCKKALGLYEPLESAVVVQKNDLDLLIVPGVLFRTDGYRIGFGAGFYDRYLMDYQGATISLCYREQITADFMPEPHDLPVQKLVIENNLK